MAAFSAIPLRLESERLVMTPQEPDDAGWLAELFTARGRGTVTRGEAAERIAVMQRTVAELGIGARVLRTRTTGEVLGYCAIVLGRSSLAEPELAYELLPSARGHGYATEGSRVLLAEAFATGRTAVWATVRTWNAPSFRVLDRLGFHRDHVSTDADGELAWLVVQYHDRYHPRMPMTLRLTDDETTALRAQAEHESRSMQDVAREAIREYVETHSRRALLDEVLDRELPRYAEALDRLGK